MALLVVYNNVGATVLTAGNDASLRANLDAFSNFVVVDTNHPVSVLGKLSTFNYYASNTNNFRFLLVDSSNKVIWVSESITPAGTGEQSYSPASPVVVHGGDNIGLYFESTGTIPFESSGNASWYMSNGSGLPGVGAVLVFAGSSDRTYSFSATGVVGEMPSVPAITSPVNNSTLASASFNLVNWTDSTGTFDPFVYQFEMYSSATYAPSKLVASSSWQSASEFTVANQPEGSYYLRVRSKDSIGTISAWSNSEAGPYKVIIDNPDPTPTPTSTPTPTITPTPTPTPSITPTPSPTDFPTTKDDCKKGGWAKFKEIFFKNQGQCVSHINGRDDNHGQHVRNAEDKKEAAKSDVGKHKKDHDDEGEDEDEDDDD